MNSTDAQRVEYYDFGGIRRLKFLIYQILATLAQVALMGLGFLIGGGDSNKDPSLVMIIYILLVAGLGIIYGIYLLYQRSKNIGINPWIGIALAMLPIINIFWGLGLYILPEGFWEEKRLDTAAKVWGGLAIAFVLLFLLGAALLIPALTAAVNAEKQRLGQTQADFVMDNKVFDSPKNPLELSYGLDTKCPDYQSTQKSFEKILNAVKSQNPENSKIVLSEIAQNQGSLNPLVIGMAANLMVQRGQTEKAVFWFYAGELRTLSDLNLYQNREIPGIFLQEYLGGDFNGGRVTALTPNTRGEIELFIGNNRENAKAQLAKALAWDKKTPKNYNRLWLGKKDSIPQSQWLAQDQKTRKKFGQSELASIGVGPVDSVFKPR
jgi:hypothetical protein